MQPDQESSSKAPSHPETERRPTGIGAVGDLPWGTHLCHFYETKADLLDLVLPFLKTGLEQGEACLWVISNRLSKEEAQHALQLLVPDLPQHLRRGRLEILTPDEWYLQEGTFELPAVIDRCTRKLNQALARGDAGLRLTGDGSWVRDQERESFRQYEQKLSGLVAHQRLLVLCTYPLAQSGAAKVLEVARCHQVALARRNGVLEVLQLAALEQDRARMQRRVIDDAEKLGIPEGSLRRGTSEPTWPEELLVEHVRLCALGGTVALRLTQSGELRVVLQACVEALVEHLDAAFARLWTLDSTGQILELQASAGLYTRLNGQYSRIPLSTLKVGRIAQSRQPHLTNDVQHDPQIDDHEWARQTGIIAFAGYPLVVEGQLQGVVGLFARQELSDLTFQALALCAGAIALAIRRIRAEAALRQSEAELAHADEALEFAVGQRTADLQNALAEVEHFSRTLTHDLQSPLRRLRSFSEILTQKVNPPRPEQAAQFLQQIKNTTQQMDRLIRDALEYRRLVRQQLPLELIAPQALLQSLIDSNPEFQPPRATIHLREPLPPVLGNAIGLRQAFSNLLANAVKFVQAGTLPQVEIFSERRAEWMRLCFQDNGIGMAPEFQPQLFHAFQRGTSEFPGTGLGLALVKRVVEHMGGKTGADSELGKGSCFWIELPGPNLPELAIPLS